MGLTVLFLSPNFPVSFPNFIAALRHAGCTPLAIGDAPWDELSDVIKDNVKCYCEVGCMDDYDAVYKEVAGLINHFGRIHWVQSHTEHWLATEARIREDFNIKGGYYPDDLTKFNLKSSMKLIFQKLDLRVARGKVMNSYDQIMDFVHNKSTGVGYPIIVKPDNGVGSINTFKLNDDCEVQHFFSNCFVEHPQDYIFEEFIVGDLVTFDGLADKNSDIVFYGTTNFAKPLLEIAQGDSDGVSAFVSRKVPSDLIEIGKRLVQVFKVRGHFFHFEFFRTKSGEHIILEVNLRLPGGRAIDLYNFAYDSDFFQLWADVVADNTESVHGWMERFALSPHPLYYVCYTSRRWCKRYKYSNEEITEQCTQENCEDGSVQVLVASEVPNYSRDNMGNFAFIFRAKEESTMHDMINTISMRGEKYAGSCRGSLDCRDAEAL